MSDRALGKKRTVWFTLDQIDVMDEILSITGREVNVSSAIREGLKLYLASLKKK